MPYFTNILYQSFLSSLWFFQVFVAIFFKQFRLNPTVYLYINREIILASRRVYMVRMLKRERQGYQCVSETVECTENPKHLH